ncbi:LD-carboxypeptidase [Nocardioides sp. JQ2195]|uniref:S66 family peptidase n=1 Tax=Nocardioides sp. JQ2195 TaxID=2592334 RepID=UPI00143EB27A|nr:S66 peptidase family protein [Nocardioides sp. JQ2195]QIX26120.1 LD-carboxypeptidase [Nocardioides sp. JQ2195]
MSIRFPRPLARGDLIGITSPSAGVEDRMQGRLQVALDSLRGRGYDVRVGQCMSADQHVSAPKQERADELMEMLLDPAIRAVVPPWGGELAVDLLDLLDWEVLASAEPTWLVGYSDMSTVMVPLTLRSGWATLHGANLMDSPYDPPEGLLHWTDVAAATADVVQNSPGRFRTPGRRDDYVDDPGVRELDLDAEGGWSVLGGGDLEVSGRLIGGCTETLGAISGTPYADVAAFGREHADEGIIVYVEACDFGAFDVARILHGFRLAGWFEHANAILVGRPLAPDSDGFTQQDAAADALGDLGVPVVLDVDCGHVAPFLPLVNGASARITLRDGRGEVTQHLG